jgi:WD40 repeat protein
VNYSPDGSLFSGDASGNLYRWNSHDNSSKVWRIGKGIITSIAITKNGRYVSAISLSAKEWNDVPAATSEFTLLDLKENKTTRIESNGNRLFRATFDPSGTRIVTGDMDGIVRVGAIHGETPHVLFGHQTHVGDVAVDPTGRWIASTEFSKGVVRLWPMPIAEPLQTLPHEKLMNRLRQLTNVRVVADKNSSTGYRVEFSPFPGWALKHTVTRQ